MGILNGEALLGDYMDPKEDTVYDHSQAFDESKFLTRTMKLGRWGYHRRWKARREHYRILWRSGYGRKAYYLPFSRRLSSMDM
jgi:hypothetical protein